MQKSGAGGIAPSPPVSPALFFPFSFILKMCAGSHTILNVLIYQEIILLYLKYHWTTKTALVLQQNENMAEAYSELNQSFKL